MKEMALKCKDFDAWVSFLGRLNKIGSDYFIKNDVIMATKKGTKSGSNNKIPGRHLTRDPLFIDDTDCYVEDGVYILLPLESLIDYFKSIRENNKDARKMIIYKRDKEGIYIQFSGLGDFQIATLMTIDYDVDNDNNYVGLASGITWFDNLVDTVETWKSISDEDLVNLRNNEVLMLEQEVGGTHIWSRVARSIFITSGVSRLNTPLARHIDYTFFSLDTKDSIGIMRLHAMYNNPGSSKLINVECIHEYTILIYDEGVN